MGIAKTLQLKRRWIQAPLAHLLLLGPLFAALNCLATQPDLSGDWPTFGNGATHSGYFPGTLNGLPFVQKWKTPMPHSSITYAAIGGGRVYLAVGYYYSAMSLRALDANTGVGVWTNNLASTFSVNPPTYDSGAVFMQQTDGGAAASFVRSFDATNGHTNWSTSYSSQGDRVFAPIVTNGAVYGCTGLYGGLTGYNRTNGVLKFFTGLYGNLGCDSWTPAYYNGKLYMWVNGFFSEHDPQTGAVHWILTNASPYEFSYSMYRTVAIADGRAYFTSTTKLFGVDLNAHQNVWTNNGAFSGTPAVANGVVYAISNSVVQAFSTNGVFVRTYNTTNQTEQLVGQLIVTDDVLIVAGQYGVYVFRLTDGTIQQFISGLQSSCNCYSTLSISLANNTLYVTSGDQNVYAYAAMPTTAPTLAYPVQIGNGGIRFSFTNISGASFRVWASTNAALPSNGWTFLGYTTEVASGQYQFTDLTATNYNQRYYCVSSP